MEKNSEHNTSMATLQSMVESEIILFTSVRKSWILQIFFDDSAVVLCVSGGQKECGKSPESFMIYIVTNKMILKLNKTRFCPEDFKGI